jgi:hypothetical protein
VTALSPSDLPCYRRSALFFSEDRADERAACARCESCPVRARCLQAALNRDERDGVWGGFTYMERRFWVMEHGTTVEDPVKPLTIQLYSARAT